jgi:citrate synthase
MESLYTEDIKLHSRLKFRIIDVMKNFPEKAHLIEVLQPVVSCLGMFYKKENVLNEDYQYLSIVKILAKIPLIIANWNRIRNGDNPLEPSISKSKRMACPLEGIYNRPTEIYIGEIDKKYNDRKV